MLCLDVRTGRVLYERMMRSNDDGRYEIETDLAGRRLEIRSGAQLATFKVRVPSSI